MSINVIIKNSLFVSVLFPAVLVVTGCAVVDNITGGSEPLQEPIYDGNWIARVESYRISQKGPAKSGASLTNWTCGDGEPFEFPINVSEGVVTVPNRQPISPGRISVKNRFKTTYRRTEDRTTVLSGNFKTLTGTRQERKDSLNGCYYRFKIIKGK